MWREPNYKKKIVRKLNSKQKWLLFSNCYINKKQLNSSKNHQLPKMTTSRIICTIVLSKINLTLFTQLAFFFYLARELIARLRVSGAFVHVGTSNISSPNFTILIKKKNTKKKNKKDFLKTFSLSQLTSIFFFVFFFAPMAPTRTGFFFLS